MQQKSGPQERLKDSETQACAFDAAITRRFDRSPSGTNRHVKGRAGMETATYFLEKAAQCRRLADAINRWDDPTKVALSALADEFEANAKAIQARAMAARQIGGDPTG